MNVKETLILVLAGLVTQEIITKKDADNIMSRCQVLEGHVLPGTLNEALNLLNV